MGQMGLLKVRQLVWGATLLIGSGSPLATSQTTRTTLNAKDFTCMIRNGHSLAAGSWLHCCFSMGDPCFWLRAITLQNCRWQQLAFHLSAIQPASIVLFLGRVRE